MGKIILIGGNVDRGMSSLKGKDSLKLKKPEPKILLKILSAMKGKKSKIEIITSASKNPNKIGKEYTDALKALDCRNVNLMHFTTRQHADKKEFLERISSCDGIIITGGDQVLLIKTLLKSKLLLAIKKRFNSDPDFLVSGTSAGAMALPDIMIADGNPSEALSKGYIEFSKGLGILKGVIVDTHFVQRGRFGRLIEATATYPSLLGIGLGENTGVVFQNPEMVETIGSNLVVLIDASQLSYNNIARIRKDDEICVQDMKLHILPKRHKFNIIKKEIYPAKKKVVKEKKRQV
ncbi:MAG: cyanophycinase [Bacteroidota bacterium]